MGLDMYLSERRATCVIDMKKKQELARMFPKLFDGEPFPNDLEIRIAKNLIYWRKVNQIHNWFVENVQSGEDDCGRYNVDGYQLYSLYNTITKVLNDHSKAEKLLPTTSGSFFGSTEYDESYFNDLEITMKKLKPIIEDPYLDIKCFSYEASW